MSIALKIYFIRENIRTIRRYYSNFYFALADLTLSLLYTFCNPYRHCRKFLEKIGEKQIYAYGETPFSTLETIAREVNATSQDYWLELGSGRGKAALWIASFIGCRTTGIEWVPRFVKRANFTARLFRLSNLSYECKNILDAPFKDATIIYLYGTTWDDELIGKIQEKILTLQKRIKLVIISSPLKNTKVIKTFKVSFPWGNTSAYLHYL
jgi:SAM-dependent methyltransferase